MFVVPGVWANGPPVGSEGHVQILAFRGKA